jgi:hypothetical protein
MLTRRPGERLFPQPETANLHRAAAAHEAMTAPEAVYEAAITARHKAETEFLAALDRAEVHAETEPEAQ